jgi:hypothetical protein
MHADSFLDTRDQVREFTRFVVRDMRGTQLAGFYGGVDFSGEFGIDARGAEDVV